MELARRYIAFVHGAGDEMQYQFYRCCSCMRLVNWKRIRQGGCVCMGSKVRPAQLTFLEKLRVLFAPWTI